MPENPYLPPGVADSNSVDRGDQSAPSIRSRLFAILAGAMYLTILAFVFATLTALPIIVTGPLVLAGAVTIVAVLAVLAGRLVRNERRTKRFGLSSILLLFIPLSIYLAALRVLFDPIADEQLPIAAWGVILVFALIFLALSTVILVRFAEAVLWVAVQLQRRRSSGSGPIHRRHLSMM